MQRERLDHAETKGSATDAAAGTAKGGAIEFVELAIKLLAILDPFGRLIFATALVGILVGALLCDRLRTRQLTQPVDDLFLRWIVLDFGGFRSQHFLD